MDPAFILFRNNTFLFSQNPTFIFFSVDLELLPSPRFFGGHILLNGTELVCFFNFQPEWQELLRVYDPPLFKTHVFGPIPPGASGDVDFYFSKN